MPLPVVDLVYEDPTAASRGALGHSKGNQHRPQPSSSPTSRPQTVPFLAAFMLGASATFLKQHESDYLEHGLFQWVRGSAFAIGGAKPCFDFTHALQSYSTRCDRVERLSRIYGRWQCGSLPPASLRRSTRANSVPSLEKKDPSDHQGKVKTREPKSRSSKVP